MASTHDQSVLEERRESPRWRTRKGVLWRMPRGRHIHCATILERSLNGMVLEIHARDAPRVGAHLLPGDSQTAQRHGFRDALVRRVYPSPLGRSDARLVIVEILA